MRVTQYRERERAKLHMHLTSSDWLKVDFWIQGPVAADTLHIGTIFDQSEESGATRPWVKSACINSATSTRPV